MLEIISQNMHYDHWQDDFICFTVVFPTLFNSLCFLLHVCWSFIYLLLNTLKVPIELGYFLIRRRVIKVYQCDSIIIVKSELFAFIVCSPSRGLNAVSLAWNSWSSSSTACNCSFKPWTSWSRASSALSGTTINYFK